MVGFGLEQAKQLVAGLPQQKTDPIQQQKTDPTQRPTTTTRRPTYWTSSGPPITTKMVPAPTYPPGSFASSFTNLQQFMPQQQAAQEQQQQQQLAAQQLAAQQLAAQQRAAQQQQQQLAEQQRAAQQLAAQQQAAQQPETFDSATTGPGPYTLPETTGDSPLGSSAQVGSGTGIYSPENLAEDPDRDPYYTSSDPGGRRRAWEISQIAQLRGNRPGTYTAVETAARAAAHKVNTNQELTSWELDALDRYYYEIVYKIPRNTPNEPSGQGGTVVDQDALATQSAWDGVTVPPGIPAGLTVFPIYADAGGFINWAASNGTIYDTNGNSGDNTFLTNVSDAEFQRLYDQAVSTGVPISTAEVSKGTGPNPRLFQDTPRLWWETGADPPAGTYSDSPPYTTQPPTDPSLDDPTDPPLDDPTDPSLDDPTDPSLDDPTDPSLDDPTDPSLDDPTASSYQNTIDELERSLAQNNLDMMALQTMMDNLVIATGENMEQVLTQMNEAAAAHNVALTDVLTQAALDAQTAETRFTTAQEAAQHAAQTAQILFTQNLEAERSAATARYDESQGDWLRRLGEMQTATDERYADLQSDFTTRQAAQDVARSQELASQQERFLTFQEQRENEWQELAAQQEEERAQERLEREEMNRAQQEASRVWQEGMINDQQRFYAQIQTNAQIPDEMPTVEEFISGQDIFEANGGVIWQWQGENWMPVGEIAAADETVNDGTFDFRAWLDQIGARPLTQAANAA